MTKDMKLPAALIMLALAPVLSGTVQAGLLTANTLTGASVIDFSDQPGQNNVIGPVQIGALVGQDVTVESSSGSNGLYFNYTSWALPFNGDWGNGRTYVSLNGSVDSMIFSFNDGPVSAVGGFMSYARDYADNLMITALDSTMSVLETHNITAAADIITPVFNDGAFRGISRSTPDISYFVVSGGLANALDDLTFEAIPEPASIGLIGLFTGGIWFVRRFFAA